MTWLDEFKRGDFTRQVNTLLEISRQNNTDALAGLYSLYNNSIGDKPVDAMVEHTLRDLLNNNESETMGKIASGTKKEKILCMHISRVCKYTSLSPQLVDLARKEKDGDILEELFLCMEDFADPLFLDTFRAHLKDRNEVIAGISIGMTGTFKDEDSLPLLKEIIEKAGVRNLRRCSLQTAKALQAMAEIGCEEALAFLISKIHHKNPIVRNILHEHLVNLGEAVVHGIGELFRTADTDSQIMAANVLGRIASRAGGKILVAALELDCAAHPNVRFAIYEALGFIPFTKGVVALIDGLNDGDDLTSMAVVTALEKQYNPYIGSQIQKLLEAGKLDIDRILTTIRTVKAVNIFEFLYTSGALPQERLIDALSICPGPEIREAFARKLKDIGTEQALEHMQSISQQAQTPAGEKIKVLAVDDSLSMQAFYRSVCTAMGMDTVTAENGQIAWQQLELQGNDAFDLLILDMNMPVMDGIQLTQKIRASENYASIPIIMATTESDKSQVRLAKKSGVNEFIIKPIKKNVLEKKLNKYLKIQVKN